MTSGGRLQKQLSIFIFLALMVASLFATLPSAMAENRSLEVFSGAITFHFIDQGSSSEFRNKLSRDGRLIYNPIYGLRIINENAQTYSAIAAFMGNNSVGLPMGGGMFSLGIKGGGEHLFLGLAAGAYIQDNNQFRSHKADPFRIYETKGGVGVVPIAGLEMGVRVHFSDKVYFKLYDLLTPVVNSTFVLLGYTF